MNKEYKVSETGCRSCKFHLETGITRYCGGFKKRKRPRRFTSSDPKIKAPKWCPKRLNPVVIRVYRYKDEDARFFGELSGLSFSRNDQTLMFPMGHHYVLAFETRLNVTVASLQGFSGCAYFSEVCGFSLESGDVIEVDNGLAIHQFFCKHMNLVPAYFTPPHQEGG